MGNPAAYASAPERSLAQRLDALQHANEVRVKRAALKRDLTAGRASIHMVLLEPPDFVETAKVFDVLLAVPKYGRVKVNKLLQVARISPSKTVGGLSQRQRAELISMLRRVPGPRYGRPEGPTEFQKRVLNAAIAIGSAGPRDVERVASVLHKQPGTVAFGRRELARLGLLDEQGVPTPAGRAYAAGHSSPTRETTR